MKYKNLIIITGAIMAFIVVGMMVKEKDISALGLVSVAMAGQGELCSKHQVPLAECFTCDSSLREPGRLWCNEHGRYEDRCFVCHPEIKEAGRLWCDEHNLYEDECVFCRPELREVESISKEEEVDRPPVNTGKTGSTTALQCNEHGVLEKDCGICHPDLTTTLLPGQSLMIRLESTDSALKAGIVTSQPSRGSSLAVLVALSQVSYDQNHLAHITPLAAGVVQKVAVNVGDTVAKGQVLVEIASHEISRAKSAYLSALANETLKELIFKREKGLVERKISSQQEYEQAATEYRLAENNTMMTRQQLVNYGLTEQQIQQTAETRSTSSLLQIFAPFSGTLVDRKAVVGEAVKPGASLFTLADLSSMWLEITIPEDKIATLKVGDQVEATFDAHQGVTARGQLVWLASGIDEQSRMMKARAIVPNPGRLLKHGMFGQVRFLPQQNHNGLHVPVAALQYFNGNAFVFVRLADDLYEIRRVTLGGRDKSRVEILAGVTDQEEVVVAHSYTLKSEFLKSRLGAGCVD